jgi:hypothetical protein
MIARAGLHLVAAAALFAACSIFSRPPPTDVQDAPSPDAGPAAEEPSLEEEEVSLEGLGKEGTSAQGDPIAVLISSIGAKPSGEAAEETSGSAAPPAPAPAAGTSGDTAFDIWSMTDEACRARLDEAGVAVSTPDFETPFVKQPLLLDGPIRGVTIRPKWRRELRVNEVMDCRLLAALVDTAEIAHAFGFAELRFYSTYRPIKNEAKAGKASMHRRGLAIDVGWLTTSDGAAVEVLESYELHAGEPPCDAAAETDLGRRLRDFACALHDGKIFNVVLTPNANKAHHNHFHLDITPDARWYIIR